jgi:hypothetical protein
VAGKNHANGLFRRTRNGHEGCLSDAWDASAESVVDFEALLGEVQGYLEEQT